MEGVATTSSVTPETSAPDSSAADAQELEGGAEAAKKGQDLSADEMEEIALGSVKGKVPKHLAKAIKDYERGIQGKFQEAAETKKQAKAMLDFAKSDPKGFFQKLGMDPYEFAEATLAEKIEMLSMSPEQREAMEAKRELEQYKSREREVQERQKKEREVEEIRKHEATLSQEIAQALKDFDLVDKTTDLADAKLLMEQVVAQMIYADKRGEQLSAREAAARVKDKYLPKVERQFRSMSPEKILKLLGDQKWNELREYDLKRVTGTAPPTVNSAARPGNSQKSPVTSSARRSSQEKPMNEKEFRAYLETLKE